MLKEIALNDGTTHKIDTRLNIKKLMFINRDFDTKELVKITVGKDESMDLDFVKAYNAVYVAYRQANMNEYISYDHFVDLYDLDMTEALNIYAEMFLSGNKRNGYAKAFEDDTFSKKPKTKSGSRNSK